MTNQEGAKRAWFSGFPVIVRKANDWKVSVDRDLPIEQAGSWDGAKAQAQIFSWAGWPDNPNPSKARRCFMFSGGGSGTKKGSYKHPICIIKDGKPVVSSAALAASLGRLDSTQGPSNAAKDRARAVAEHYRAKLEKKTGEGLRGGKVE